MNLKNMTKDDFFLQKYFLLKKLKLLIDITGHDLF